MIEAVDTGKPCGWCSNIDSCEQVTSTMRTIKEIVQILEREPGFLDISICCKKIDLCDGKDVFYIQSNEFIRSI